MARSWTQAGPERTNRMILLGAVGLAVVAAILVFAGLSNFGGSGNGNSDFGSTVNVVVAATDIKAGTKITADMLELATVPSRAMIAGAVTDKDAVVGLTTLYPLQKNDEISASKLGQSEKDLGFTGTIPTGMRAISIPVTESTMVGGLIVGGDHVDVTAVYDKAGSNSVAQASTLLQNVLVLSVGQTTAKPVARLDANGTPLPPDSQIAAPPDNTSAKPTAKTVTLAVSPQDVVTIALAQDQGTLYLSLRSTGDTASVQGVDAPRQLPAPAPTP
jgi:pilus assembly protein CpaB